LHRAGWGARKECGSFGRFVVPGSADTALVLARVGSDPRVGALAAADIPMYFFWACRIA